MENFKVGDSVTYTAPHGEKEHGVVKSLQEDHAFVVYHCNGEWHKYKDYTPARTRKSDLSIGWN